jgi:hypothetical protein
MLKIFLFKNILKLLFFIFLNLFLLSTQRTAHKNKKIKIQKLQNTAVCGC